MTVATDFCNLLYRLADEHSGEDLPLVLEDVPILLIQDRESAQRVLRTDAAKYEKNMPWFRQALGPSRMTENGDEWRLRQRLSQTHFAKFDRQETFVRCTLHAHGTLRQLVAKSAAGDSAIDDAILREMAAAVMLESFFGRSPEEAGVGVADIAKMIAFGSEYAFVPNDSSHRFDPKLLRAFLSVRARVLDDLSSFREGEVAEDSLLAQLRKMDAAEGNGFVLEHELTLFFAAGAETTAASMGWACWLLSRHPDIQEELRAEVEAFWATGNPDWNHLSELPKLENFVSEVLRIFPATPVIGRKAVAEDRLGKFDVKAGDQILVSLVGLQHDTRVHPEPWKVDIHARGPGGAGHSLSFGVGARVCGGARFASVEMMSFLSIFLKDARFEAVHDGPPLFRWQSQLLHEGGQPVKVLPAA